MKQPNQQKVIRYNGVDLDGKPVGAQVIVDAASIGKAYNPPLFTALMERELLDRAKQQFGKVRWTQRVEWEEPYDPAELV